MSWVKFHKELNQGDKRALPRAVRYIYMELSLMARELDGMIPVSKKLSMAEAVHDLIGGNKDEIDESIELLFGHEADDEPMLSMVLDGPRKFIRVNAWDRWNDFDKSAERMKKLRERRASKPSSTMNSPMQQELLPCDGHVTRHVTVSDTSRDRHVTSRDGNVTLLEKKRKEERINPPKAPPPHQAHKPEPVVGVEPEPKHEPVAAKVAEEVTIAKQPEKTMGGQGTGKDLIEYFRSFPYLTASDVDRLAGLAVNRTSKQPSLDDVVAESIAQLHKAQVKTFIQSPSGWLRNKIEQLLRLDAKQFADLTSHGRIQPSVNQDAALLADITQSEAMFARQNAERSKAQRLEPKPEDPKKLASLVANTLQSGFSERPSFVKARPNELFLSQDSQPLPEPTQPQPKVEPQPTASTAKPSSTPPERIDSAPLPSVCTPELVLGRHGSKFTQNGQRIASMGMLGEIQANTVFQTARAS